MVFTFKFIDLNSATNVRGRMAKWIRRLTTDQEIPGSSPGVLGYSFLLFTRLSTELAHLMILLLLPSSVQVREYKSNVETELYLAVDARYYNARH